MRKIKRLLSMLSSFRFTFNCFEIQTIFKQALRGWGEMWADNE